MNRNFSVTAVLALCATLAACGGGGSGGGSTDLPDPPVLPPVTPPDVVTPLTLSSLELAQTHVLPPAGRSWTLSEVSESLHFVGGREALVLVGLAQADVSQPVIEGWRDGVRLGEVTLDAPNLLPPTEAGGAAYSSSRYSATLPATWMQPGLQLRVVADNYGASEFRDVIIGADMSVMLHVLPFYLFGADNNDRAHAQTAQPDAATVDEIYAKWPVARLTVQNHPAQRVNWPTLVIGPSGSAPAYVMDSSDDEQAGFQVLGAVLGVIGRLLDANGEDAQAVQIYAPVVQQDAAGNYSGPGGGLGSIGGDTGVGDDAFAGIFIHEQGHAMGLPHVGEAYDDGRYPYFWGSIDGSAWGYDAIRSEFLPPPLPVTANRFDGCQSDSFAGNPRAIDDRNRCIKQDPMQSGSGDQDPSYRFATFSDYSTAMMQRHMEEEYVVADSAFASGYKRWDWVNRRWNEFLPTTTNNAQSGFDGGFPIQRNVPVYSIALTLSRTQTPGATQIYPPIRYTGNLIRTVDPTDPMQRDEVRNYRSPYNGTGAGRWYCVNSGCDYTLRVRYANGVVRHVLLQGAFRSFDDAGGSFRPNSGNPNHSDSFRSYLVNVPDEGALLGLELLDTPLAWDVGLPPVPAVLASR